MRSRNVDCKSKKKIIDYKSIGDRFNPIKTDQVNYVTLVGVVVVKEK